MSLGDDFFSASYMRSTNYRAPFGPSQECEVDEQMATKLLREALSRGADYADLFFEYRAASGFGFDEGILKSASRGVAMGIGIRAQKGDSTGYAYVEQFDWDTMKRAAQTAAQIAASGASLEPLKLEHKSLPKRYELSRLSLDALGTEKRALLERAAKRAHEMDPKVVKVEASFSEEIREILVFTSEGKMAYDVQPLFRFGVNVIAQHNGKRQSGSSGGGGRSSLAYFDLKSPEWHAEQAVKQALVMLDAKDAPAGEMEVLLAPGDSGILLHEAVGHGLEADFNRKKTSNYSDAIGQQVASNLCTVIDDATMLQSRGTINVDDEGNTPGCSVLIEKGKLVSYMHDRLSASHFKLRPSGNGRRESFASAPLPRMTNTILTAGPHEPEEMLRSIKRGVFAKRFGGGQVDISNGDFVFSLTESYLIEDGKITSPLKGVNLIGNGPEVLRRVVMLGSDVEVSDGVWTCGKDGQSVPVGVGCPSIKISQITVGGTKV